MVTLNNVQSSYKFKDDNSKKSWNTTNYANKGGFCKRKKSLNKMFKMKRRDSNDGKLPMITQYQTENRKLKGVKGIEKFSTFDSIVRTTNRRFASQSPSRTKRRHKVSRSRNRSK